MRIQATRDRSSAAVEPTVALPPGTPAWITPRLVALTLRVWQPYYTTTLSVADAVAIVQNAGRLWDALARAER